MVYQTMHYADPRLDWWSTLICLICQQGSCILVFMIKSDISKLFGQMSHVPDLLNTIHVKRVVLECTD